MTSTDDSDRNGFHKTPRLHHSVDVPTSNSAKIVIDSEYQVVKPKTTHKLDNHHTEGRLSENSSSPRTRRHSKGLDHPFPQTISKHSIKSDGELNSELRRRRSSFFRRSSIMKAPPKLEKIKDYLTECLEENGRLNIRFYILAFREIVKFLCCLGTILSFASRDIEVKVDRMDELLASDNKRYYIYLDDMMQFELERGIVSYEGADIQKGRHSKKSGTRIMYRLHQALAFLVQFFTNVREQPLATMHTIVNEAYKATISKNHGWLMKKTATLAFHAIPGRATLIKKMGSTTTEIQVMLQLGEINSIATQVYTATAVILDRYSKIASNEPKTLNTESSSTSQQQQQQ